MSYKIITPASEEPVTLAEAKAHCRIDDATDDVLVAALIVAAREQAEHETGRAMCTQTWELVLDSFPDACVLRFAPVASVVSIKYLDIAGIQQTLDPQDALFDSDSAPGYLTPAYGKTWPESYAVPNAVRVRYICGYGAAAAVPQGIKQWMLLAIGTMYAQRETMISGNVTALPDRFWHRLLDPYRIYEAV